MAKIEIDGLSNLMENFEEVMNLPEEIKMDMLNAEADVVIEAQKKELENLGLKDTGQLKQSIVRTVKFKKKKSYGMGQYLDVGPYGYRENGVQNPEVGFIYEFGAPNRDIKGIGWMKKANEKCASETEKAAAEVFDKFLKEKNL